ncbi:MAG: UDP-glucose 4-epimerase GalE [Halobacteriovoraceae bacterium]|nr:UDP-glucose 4-epimerase GalE [Halobacteriovoraceae bacterium]
MKILLTGGAGYIGSHVLKILGEQGHDIVVVDNLSTGRKESLLYGRHENFNLEDTDKLGHLIEKEDFEACLHFAGSIVVPESVQKPLKYYKNNTQNSMNLIELCKQNNINKFIFSSTAALYGDAPKGGICSEDSDVLPINPYGKSKFMTEMMLEDVSKVSEFNYVALRYFNVAGANVDLKIGQCSPNSTHLIKIASECASGKREKMSIFGEDYDTPDGTCIRDYIHIDDLAQAHADALAYLEKENESIVVNCGYGHGYSVKEVINAVKEVTGVDFPVEMDGRRDGDAATLVSKAEKIKKILGWTPKHDDLKMIVKTAFEWEKILK